MQARSNAPYSVRAFTGHEFVTYEWRAVPPGYEESARSHPLLSVREHEEESLQEPEEVDATDAARALASEHGIDLSGIDGSGLDGRIVLSDVRDIIGE